MPSVAMIDNYEKKVFKKPADFMKVSDEFQKAIDTCENKRCLDQRYCIQKNFSFAQDDDYLVVITNSDEVVSDATAYIVNSEAYQQTNHATCIDDNKKEQKYTYAISFLWNIVNRPDEPFAVYQQCPVASFAGNPQMVFGNFGSFFPDSIYFSMMEGKDQCKFENFEVVNAWHQDYTSEGLTGDDYFSTQLFQFNAGKFMPFYEIREKIEIAHNKCAKKDFECFSKEVKKVMPDYSYILLKDPKNSEGCYEIMNNKTGRKVDLMVNNQTLYSLILLSQGYDTDGFLQG